MVQARQLVALVVLTCSARGGDWGLDAGRLLIGGSGFCPGKATPRCLTQALDCEPLSSGLGELECRQAVNATRTKLLLGLAQEDPIEYSGSQDQTDGPEGCYVRRQGGQAVQLSWNPAGQVYRDRSQDFARNRSLDRNRIFEPVAVLCLADAQLIEVGAAEAWGWGATQALCLAQFNPTGQTKDQCRYQPPKLSYQPIGGPRMEVRWQVGRMGYAQQQECEQDSGQECRAIASPGAWFACDGVGHPRCPPE